VTTFGSVSIASCFSPVIFRRSGLREAMLTCHTKTSVEKTDSMANSIYCFGDDVENVT